jgi:hypothetical protein
MTKHWDTRTECPECQSPLDVIRLIDATDRAMGAGVGHVDLAFASANAQSSSMTGTMPTSGVVKAKLCSGCGRIYLYATTTAGGLPR